MRYLFLFLFLTVGCSHSRKASQDEEVLVGLNAALNHAQASYLKGCVDAYHEMKQQKIFNHCSEKAKKHRTEIDNLINSP